VGTALELVAVIIFPTAAAYAVIGGFRAFRWYSDRRDRNRAVTTEPIERLSANLRRLRAELEAVENKMGTPAKNLRLRALRAAYIDALCSACQRLEVSQPPAAGASQAEIYRVESALRERGLDVRQMAPR
jgi:ElaB/YqjD/DUF883 family membrane-anchored ribosome-binding protein